MYQCIPSRTLEMNNVIVSFVSVPFKSILWRKCPIIPQDHFQVFSLVPPSYRHFTYGGRHIRKPVSRSHLYIRFSYYNFPSQLRWALSLIVTQSISEMLMLHKEPSTAAPYSSASLLLSSASFHKGGHTWLNTTVSLDGTHNIHEFVQFTLNIIYINSAVSWTAY